MQTTEQIICVNPCHLWLIREAWMGDIPLGKIYGLGYDPEKDQNNPANWRRDYWDVGLQGINRQPKHL